VKSDGLEPDVVELASGHRRVVFEEGTERFGGDAEVVKRWFIESRSLCSLSSLLLGAQPGRIES
jgi:hypothetical protein